MTGEVRGAQVIRFATFEVDARSGELRKSGMKLKLGGQSFQVLAILLEQPGTVVTREELQKRLWPDTFVDIDHSLNTAINKIREALGDSSENPRFVETLPRRGYRFIHPVIVNGTVASVAEPSALKRPATGTESSPKYSAVRSVAVLAAFVAVAIGGIWIYQRTTRFSSPQRTLTRLTFDEGLQTEPTWSPDGRLIAYSADRGGKFDIWVQQIGSGNPVQVTNSPGNNWQPDWSPDGKSIVYRSEDGEGGLYVAPALGGAGLERKIASFGYYPRWSPDGTQILFRTHLMIIGVHDHFYVVDVNGGQPREVLADVIPERDYHTDSAAWHPDGKRISVLLWSPSPSPAFWTEPVSGGSAIRSEISPEASKRFAEASVAGSIELIGATKFSWAPSGNAIYFDRIYRGTRNLWKMTIEPATLRAVQAERLTVGAGYDVQPALSPDGRKLAFATQSRYVRTWIFPFDATQGRLTGSGKPVTSPGLEAWMPNLSGDGSKVVFEGRRNEGVSIWEKSLRDGTERALFSDGYRRGGPRWSPDGTRIAYQRRDMQTGEYQICVWSSQNREEVAITSGTKLDSLVYDWFPNGKSVLATIEARDTHLREVWQLPVAQLGSQSAPAPRKLISVPDHEVYQSHVSPDGRWIVFEAFKNSVPVESALYVTPTEGGPLTRISKGGYWDDKPRWSTDGKIIYYISERNAVFNVWGIHFDAAKGKALGDPFRVTSFDSPGLSVGDNLNAVEFSLVRDRFVLTMENRAGNIWMLEHVGH